MVGDIKAISPCVKSASAKLFLDLHTVSAPSGEERPLSASAQVERAARCCRCFDSDTQTRCGSVTVMVLVSSASGPRVSSCPRAPRYFDPHPVSMSRSVLAPPKNKKDLKSVTLASRRLGSEIDITHNLPSPCRYCTYTWLLDTRILHTWILHTYCTYFS